MGPTECKITHVQLPPTGAITKIAERYVLKRASTLWAVRTADEASDSRGDMGIGVRFMIALKRL